MKKPNIIFILCDEYRGDYIGHMNGPFKTPNIDLLATEGISFANAYSTYPLCTPARGSLITGKYPHALRDVKGREYIHNDRTLSFEHISIANVLNENGYDCSYIGKWHLYENNDPIPEGTARMGFDDYWAVINWGCYRTEPDMPFPEYQKKGAELRRWGPDVETELALDFLESKKENKKPFFLTLSWFPPHGPNKLPNDRKELLERAEKNDLILSENVPKRLKDMAEKEYYEYISNINGLDDHLGTILDKLKQLNLEKDTIVIFTSDHGELLYSHGLRGKLQFFEEAIRVPFVIKWPGKIKPNIVSEEYITSVDVVPTIIELAGIQSDIEFQGKSLAPYLLNKAKKGPYEEIYLEINHKWFEHLCHEGYQGNRRCLITSDYKFVIRESKEGRGLIVPEMLIDKKNDPEELNNLVNEPGYNIDMFRLMAKMKKWMKDTEDNYLLERMYSGLGTDKPEEEF